MTTRAPLQGDPRPGVSALLADPAVRRPLKAVRNWVARVPVGAAQDAGWLALALERGADERCVLARAPSTSQGYP